MAKTGPKSPLVAVPIPLEALDRAEDWLGGRDALAKALNMTRQGVWIWRSRGVPAEMAINIERVTDGAVRREELRPDIYEGMVSVIGFDDEQADA